MGTPYIVTPPDETRILRYLDVYKFIDLVLTRSLYLCRLNRLVTDPLEGRLPQRVLDKDEFVANRADRIAATVRDCVCVNCWHSQDTEDLQMWNAYAAAGTGLAIRSTIGMLKTALKPAVGEQFIGEVTYLDHQSDDCDVNGRDLTAAICIKDGSFRHEHEVRVIMVTADEGTPGIRADIDLSNLVSEVLIGPRAPKMARTAIEQLMQAHNVLRPVVLSQISPDD